MAVFKIPSSDLARRAIRQANFAVNPLSEIAVIVVDWACHLGGHSKLLL
jgi:hypothetical protein